MTKGLINEPWFTYIIECRDGSFYTGITNNLSERMIEHNTGTGSSWTRIRRPLRLCYAERHPDKSFARKREIEIKGWRREKKKALLNAPCNLIVFTQPSTQSGRRRAPSFGYITPCLRR
ncbi:MAG: GIY-YIG nuclease family protein [Verrucomicrobia bacterium]|nr:GIY-YIG nuclease family protein [Verrucomicrobiota bacterium]MBU4290033.1 GIY-YIG nuclease family protein [Verrucomicrobiota bacterium]MBU4428072.1 GIY-YIG nuclease family protein [Verrucomicrobiota bacterium]MCG2679596.1 GIY-YIG nuclease family protein [Kiritimatiellia bacterium]